MLKKYSIDYVVMPKHNKRVFTHLTDDPVEAEEFLMHLLITSALIKEIRHEGLALSVPAWWLSLGALICGFFWEMWNYFSFPKWIYHTPGAEFLRVFEMPLLGYGGYIPFALVLYDLKSFLWRKDLQLHFEK